MDEPGNRDSARSLRDLAEEALLAGVGAVALTKDRVDELAAELARKGKISQEDARRLVEETVARWRGETVRFGERAGSTLADTFRSIGLVTRRDYEELELRVAQLEHRLRLVEREPDVPPGPGP